MYIPAYVQKLMDRLERAGFEAWAVGGCVRDDALGIAPHDYDLCTSALPEQTKELFSDHDLVLAGMKHGTVGVITGEGVIEITTFRTEGDYADNRHPGWVKFVPSIREDLARRDFTVNAMAYSPIRGYADPFGGLSDLKRKRLRAVGDPVTRFREDSLRILRGARFAARFRMTIDPETKAAMLSERQLMDGLARERVLTELVQFFTLADSDLILEMEPVLTQVIPELAPCVGFDQKNPHHEYDVFGHLARVTGSLPEDGVLRFAGILHDIGKPHCMTLDPSGRGHFYGHAGISAEIADAVLRRLKASNAFREDVVWLISHHMMHTLSEPKTVRRALSRHGLERMERLLALQRADVLGTGRSGEADLAALDELASALRRTAEQEGVLTLKRLAVRGGDLIALGYPQTPELGRALNRLLELVLAGEIPNEKELLLRQAEQWINK